MCAFKNYTTMLHFFYGVDGPPYSGVGKGHRLSCVG